MEFRLGFFYGDVGSSMVWFSSSGYWGCFFLCGGVWFFWWFHHVGLRLGFVYVVVYGSSGGSIMRILGSLFFLSWGLRYRLLRFGC